LSQTSLGDLLKKTGLLKSPESESADQIASEFRGVRLKLGQALARSGQTPKWIALIQEGAIRQVLKEDGHYLTIRKYVKGEVVGVDEVLRGCKLYELHAAEDSILHLVSSNQWLGWIDEGIIKQKAMNEISEAEILEVLMNNPKWQPHRAADLLEIAKRWVSSKSVSIVNIKFENDSKSMQDLLNHSTNSSADGTREESDLLLISSSNILDHKIGEEIDFALHLQPRGLLPGRLIQIKQAVWDEALGELRPTNTPITQDLGISKEASNAMMLNLESNHLSLASAEALTSSALRDWYGDELETKKIPEELARDPNNNADVAIAILRMVSRYFEIPYKRDSIEQSIKRRTEEQPDTNISIFSFATLLDLLEVNCEFLSLHCEDLERLQLPALILDIDQKPILIWAANQKCMIISDIQSGKKVIGIEWLKQQLGASEFEALILRRGTEAKVSRFGLQWFIPTLNQYKGTLILVGIASFFVQLLALLNPLLIQQIIDAVISQGNISSLNVYGTVLIFMALTEGVLGSLRTFLLSDTTNRVDLALGATVIDHLMRLPLGYFSKRPVGEVSTRVNELEKIREFLTGTGLSTVLDVSFSFIYIAVMLIYSVPLTLWTLSVIPLFLALAFVFAPLIRRQIEKRAEAYAKVQSHLVEALSGIETVKTQNLEFQSKWRWRRLYNKQIDYGFKNVLTITSASSLSKFLDQLSGLIVIWVGAMMVLKSELTVGQLIAFRIIAGYVTGPILRLATLWQNFQETAISLERLGDVVNSPAEAEIHGQNLVPLPPIEGLVKFEGISFRFNSDGPLQLANVNLEISAGNFVGIVGGSGSGKSTLVKLITALYRPELGKILIDGYDINKVDLYSLRSQIGIVPQDSLLFDGTIRENLSLARPDATLDECVEAAKIACAHEFIEQLPNAYTSSVGERGSGLSGGQRQRLAIARMLITHPRLIILDEATSALDVDTERRVLRNLRKISGNRTLIFITHRISTLKEADQIVVMHNGLVDEVGNHSSLINLNGRYAALINQQYAEGLVE